MADSESNAERLNELILSEKQLDKKLDSKQDKVNFLPYILGFISLAITVLIASLGAWWGTVETQTKTSEQLTSLQTSTSIQISNLQNTTTSKLEALSNATALKIEALNHSATLLEQVDKREMDDLRSLIRESTKGRWTSDDQLKDTALRNEKFDNLAKQDEAFANRLERTMDRFREMEQDHVLLSSEVRKVQSDQDILRFRVKRNEEYFTPPIEELRGIHKNGTGGTDERPTYSPAIVNP